MGKFTTKLKPYFPGKRSSLILGGLLIASFILFGLAAHQARYNIGSDAISYISIAEHYARGDIKTAANGYWSPAISWLMAPLIKLGVDGRFAFAFINGLSAVFVLLAGAVLVWWRTAKNLLATSLFIVIMAIFLRSVIGDFFPDLLVVAWSAIFIFALIFADGLVSADSPRTDVATGVVLGLLGAIGYVVKLYVLPFFVGTIIAWTIVRIIAYRKKFPRLLSKQSALFFLRAPIITSIALFVFMAPWAAMLTAKYGYFTIGSSFAVNTAPKFEEPKQKATPTPATAKPKREIEEPNKEVKIAAPPYETAVTTTQDRTPRSKGNLPAVHGSQGINNFITGRKQGIPPYVGNLTIMWPPLLIVIVAGCVTIWVWRKRYQMNEHLYISLAAFIVYFAGYAALAGPAGGNVRYYWPLLFFGALITSFIVAYFGRRTQPNSLLRGGVLLLALTTVLGTYNAYPLSLNDIMREPRMSRLEEVAVEFSANVPIKPYDNYLSNNGRQNRTFAYYVNGQAYGSLGAGHDISDPGQREAMKQANINYFLHFSPEGEQVPEVSSYGVEIVKSYYLGDSFSRCRDTRSSTFDNCTLYIMKP